MTAKVLIYTSPTCGWAVRNYAALFEKGVPFEAADVKSSKAARAVFANQFPYELTPGLHHGSTLVWESLLINDYIDETFPAPPLSPAEPGERARARQWTHHCDAVLFPALYATLRDGAAAPSLQRGLDQLGLPSFMANAPAPYWGGVNRIGLVDLAYHVLFKSLRTPGLEMIVIADWMAAWGRAIATAPSVVMAEEFMASLCDRADL